MRYFSVSYGNLTTAIANNAHPGPFEEYFSATGTTGLFFYLLTAT
jgi:hypothetical protein